jgi:hypothetical protein
VSQRRKQTAGTLVRARRARRKGEKTEKRDGKKRGKENRERMEEKSNEGLCVVMVCNNKDRKGKKRRDGWMEWCSSLGCTVVQNGKARVDGERASGLTHSRYLTRRGTKYCRYCTLLDQQDPGEMVGTESS